MDARGRGRRGAPAAGRGRYPKFMREETYWISRQGGAKLRGSAGCLTETEKFQRDGCAQEKRGRAPGARVFMAMLEGRQIGVQIQQTDAINVVELQNIQCVCDGFEAEQLDATQFSCKPTVEGEK